METCESCVSNKDGTCEHNGRTKSPDDWCPMYEPGCEDYCELEENTDD